jgi:hypothetical protein
VVGVTAGASAPEELANAVVERLAPRHGVEEVRITDEEEYSRCLVSYARCCAPWRRPPRCRCSHPPRPQRRLKPVRTACPTGATSPSGPEQDTERTAAHWRDSQLDHEPTGYDVSTFDQALDVIEHGAQLVIKREDKPLLPWAFKLIEAAESRWRSVNAPHLVDLVRAGAKFDNGVMIEATQRAGSGSRRVISGRFRSARS